jgi:heterotetrameric sarcosine oxidase gamma subunit
MNQESRIITPEVPKFMDWQEFIKEIPNTALQQAGQTDSGYNSRFIELRELTGIALLRIHSLQPFEVLENSMAACDIQLPAKVNESLGRDPAAMCLAPGEWLLFSEYLGHRRLEEQVQAALETDHTVALDLSAGLAVFRLSGGGAPWLLSKLSGLDFHRGNDAAAHCARTRLQQVAVTLHYHQPGGFATKSVHDLIVDRSFASYLWRLLIASVPHAEELEQQFGNRML